MRHLDLFSGIGGFALAAQTVWGNEYENVGFCDNSEFCQQVIKKHWPSATIYGDIRNLKLASGSADLITGGFPCQPFSNAGKQKGKEDDRYLWPEMLRIIREVCPAWVVGENVVGLVNMDEFEVVCADLENTGYEVQPFIIPACAVGAPHRRDRVWIIAHSNSYGKSVIAVNGNKRQRKLGVSDTDSKRLSKRNEQGCTGAQKAASKRSELSRVCTEARRKQWEVEPGMGRVANGIPDRVDRIKTLGNAIVPQVAMEIFWAIRGSF